MILKILESYWPEQNYLSGSDGVSSHLYTYLWSYYSQEYVLCSSAYKNFSIMNLFQKVFSMFFQFTHNNTNSTHNNNNFYIKRKKMQLFFDFLHFIKKILAIC